MQPLISIIIPVYNVEHYLATCLDSILAQTYTHLQIILVDDGSTDNSSQVCEAYAQKDKRIQVIHQKNGGLCAARNTGLTYVRGEFLVFVDSDDWCDTKFIEILLKGALENNSQISCVGYYEVYPSKTQQIKVLPTGYSSAVITAREAMEKGFDKLGFYVWNKLFARSLFNGITFPYGLLFEDMVTVPQVLHKTDRVAICDVPLYYYNRSNLNSITKSKFSVKKLDYFTTSQKLLEFAVHIQHKQLAYLTKQTRAYMIAGFFRQMALTGFSDRKIITPLQRELRHNLLLLLQSSHKLTNKLFAVACCINFKVTTKLYRFLCNRYPHLGN